MTDWKGILTAAAFLAVLAAASFWDITKREIPDGCHAAILALAAVSLYTMPGMAVSSRLAGAVCVSGCMLLITLVFPGAFGGGDIKLTAAGGLFLGWRAALVSMVIAVFSAGCYAGYLLVVKRAGRSAQFAFGPFLCLGMALGLLFGAQCAA